MDDIYSKLDTGGGANDWVMPFLSSIEDRKLNKIVEFGLGVNSKYLMDNALELHSIEIVVRPEQDGWADYVRELLSEKNSRITVIKHIDAYDDELIDKIDAVFDADYDLAFVDSGAHCRGDLVNYCLDMGIPIIIAHDTAHGNEAYGWYKIEVPEEYEEKVYNSGQGTTVWIKKNNGTT